MSLDSFCSKLHFPFDEHAAKLARGTEPPGREEDGEVTSAGVAGALGLSYAHISPRNPEGVPAQPERWSGVQITPTGGYLRACRKKRVFFADGEENLGGGVRGDIRRMSAASRNRLQYKLAQLDTDYQPTFVTLTYPGKGLLPDPEKLKRDLDVFGKRLSRAGAGAIWRVEYKKRQSGEFEGEVIPHIHLFAFGMGYWEALYFVPGAWYATVGSGDDDHYQAGSRVEVIRHWGGVMSYTAKYISKQDKDDIPEGCGRFWGIINRKVIPFCPLEDHDLPDDQVNDIMRLGRRRSNVGRTGGKQKIYDKTGKLVKVIRRIKYRSANPTLNLMVNNADRWLQLLEGQSEYQAPEKSPGPAPADNPGRFSAMHAWRKSLVQPVPDRE